MAGPIGVKQKGGAAGWILGELCDLDLWPHPWAWPLIFQSPISQYLYLRNCYLIYVKQKESKSIRYLADCMVLPFDHTHDLDLLGIHGGLGGCTG